MQTFTCASSLFLRLLIIGGVGFSILLDFGYFVIWSGSSDVIVNWVALDELRPIYLNNTLQSCNAPILKYPQVLSQTFPNYDIPDNYASNSEYFCGSNRISKLNNGILTIDCPNWYFNYFPKRLTSKAYSILPS